MLNDRIVRCLAFTTSVALHAGMAAAWIAWPRAPLTLPLQQVVEVNVVMLSSLEQEKAMEQPVPIGLPPLPPQPVKEAIKKPAREFVGELPKKKVKPVLPSKEAIKKRQSSAIPRELTAVSLIEALPGSNRISPGPVAPSIAENLSAEKSSLLLTTGPQSSNAIETVAAITEPVFNAASLRNLPPAYPEEARRNGIEGKVLLDVDVTPQGTVHEVRIKHSSGHRILDYAAQAAVQHWRFIPARRDDIVVAASVLVPVKFRLE